MKAIQIAVLFIFATLIYYHFLFIEPSPKETVENWMKFYGKNYYKASTLTTSHFRDGLSEKQWAEISTLNMSTFEYNLSGGRILKKEIQNRKATIVVQANVITKKGTENRKETYSLIKKNRRWFIDGIVIGEKITKDKIKKKSRSKVPKGLIFE